MHNENPATPFYDLYGESSNRSDPGFVHIEDISTRSKGLGWVIKRHRHTRLFQILCIFEGDTIVELNRERYSLKGNWIVTIPVGVTHAFEFEPHCKGFVLSITDSILNEESGKLFNDNVIELYRVPHLINPKTTNSNFRQFLKYIELIEKEFSGNLAEQRHALSMLSRLVLLSLNRQLRDKKIQSRIGQRDSNTLSKFLALVETHYRDHWPVYKYAEQLYTSLSTLNRLCNDNLGTSPKRLIQDRLLTEAKRRLIYTREPIEDIAYTLGFKDYPYFSRFFKSQEGVTLGEYRKTADEKSKAFKDIHQ